MKQKNYVFLFFMLHQFRYWATKYLHTLYYRRLSGGPCKRSPDLFLPKTAPQHTKRPTYLRGPY